MSGPYRTAGQQRASVVAQAATKLADMMRGKRQFRDSSWPGDSTITFKLAVLSCSELQECQSRAWARFITPIEEGGLALDPTQMVNAQLFQDEVITQILYRATRESESPETYFASSADDLRDASTIDERTVMFDAYCAFQSLIDPAPTELSHELLGEIVELLKKKDQAGLAALGSRTLSSYMLSSASPPPS